jgi:hypothetical protein
MDEATALDAAVHLRNAHAPAGDAPRGGFLPARAVPASGLPGGPDDLPLVACEPQDAESLEHATPRGPRVRGRLGPPLSLGATRRGVTQKGDGEGRVDAPPVVDGLTLFLAAITRRRLKRLLGALDGPCGPVRAQRGEAGGAAGTGGSSVGPTRAAASASALPRRGANSAKARRGASPSVRRVACRTAHRPGIQ